MTYRLLDLFCGAGGAARGYADAGFEVQGVDIKPQPNYPYYAIVNDALGAFGKLMDLGMVEAYDAIHASPPCQSFTAYRRKGHGVGSGYLDLVAKTRELLEASGLPYIIENVQGAPLESPVTLCGSTFGLDIRRHRLFESNFPLVGAPCNHGWQTPRFPPAANRINPRSTVEVGAWRCRDLSPKAMGIDWMTNEELSEAIPPTYTEYLGRQLHSYIRAQKEAN